MLSNSLFSLNTIFWNLSKSICDQYGQNKIEIFVEKFERYLKLIWFLQTWLLYWLVLVIAMCVWPRSHKVIHDTVQAWFLYSHDVMTLFLFWLLNKDNKSFCVNELVSWLVIGTNWLFLCKTSYQTMAL